MTEERGRDGWKRELQLGLSLALFFLWLPLVSPHILSNWSRIESLWRMRGLLTLLTSVAGFSTVLIFDRYTARTAWEVWRLWTGVTLMLMTPVALYAPLPPLIGLFALFVSATCVAVQMLPAIKSLGAVRMTLSVFCHGVMTGGSLAAVGLPVLTWFDHTWPELYGLPAAVFACVLLTGGMAVSKQAARSPETGQDAASDLYVVIERARKTRLFAAYWAGFPICCIGSLLLAAGLYAARQTDLSATPVLRPVFLACSGGILLVFIQAGIRWLLIYATALGVSLGGLMLHAGLTGAAAAHASLLFLMLGVAGLSLLMLERLCGLAAQVNRTCVLGLGGMATFLFSWLAADVGQLRWIGERIQGNAMLFMTGSLFFLVPLLIVRELSDVPKTKTAIDIEGEKEIEESAESCPSGLEDQLTATEKKVYQLILMGYSNQQMADSLYVSINTIKFHIKNILAKAGATKKSQLMGQYLHELTRSEDRSPVANI